jgi:hypothetical protein
MAIPSNFSSLSVKIQLAAGLVETEEAVHGGTGFY